jgi:hypothetical protein
VATLRASAHPKVFPELSSGSTVRETRRALCGIADRTRGQDRSALSIFPALELSYRSVCGSIVCRSWPILKSPVPPPMIVRHERFGAPSRLREPSSASGAPASPSRSSGCWWWWHRHLHVPVVVWIVASVLGGAAIGHALEPDGTSDQAPTPQKSSRSRAGL